MTLWQPYKDHSNGLPLTEFSTLSSPVVTTCHHSPISSSLPVQHSSMSTLPVRPSKETGYHYMGYDPLPLLGPNHQTHSIISFSSDSSSDSESAAAQRKLKISRPFRQMTSKTGTTMSSIRDYYSRVLQPVTSNPKMKREVVGRLEHNETGLEYLEKRKKNNEAAKRSREVRKMKEDQLAVNLAYLEEENHSLNLKLQSALAMLELYTAQSR